MATQTVKINSRADNSGINSARDALQKMGNVANTLNTAFKGLVVAKAVGALGDLARGSMTAFEDAAVSSSRLFQAVKTNSAMTAGAFDRLSKAADTYQSKSIFDADGIKAGQAYCATLKLTEQQIAEITPVAQDVAASGVMPLDQAFENLAKTTTGTAGQFGKMNGNVKALTTEQLKHGDAIKLVAAQYRGMSNAIANTPKGQTERLKVAFGDIKETLGQIPAGLQALAFDKLLNGATGLKDKLNEGINTLFIGLEHLPETGQIVFDTLGKLFVKVFSWDFIGGVIRVCCNQIGRMFVALFDGIKKGFTSIWDTAKFNADLKKQLEGQQVKVNLAYQAKTEMSDSLEKKGIVNDYWKRNGADNPEYVKQMAGVNANLEKEQAELKRLQNIEQKNYVAAIWDGIETSIKETAKGTQESGKEALDLLKDSFGQIVSDAGKKINALSPNGKSSTLSNINSPTGGALTPSTDDTTAPVESFFDKIKSGFGGLSGFLGQFGQLGQAINSIMSGNPIGLIIQAITAFVSMFSSIENVGKVLNFFNTIFQRTGEIIAPIVNTMLAPLVDILEQVGEIVGDILAPVFGALAQILKPIFNYTSILLQVIAPFINIAAQLLGLALQMSPVLFILDAAFSILGTGIAFFFNKIILPITNFVLYIVSGIGNMIISIYNGVVKVLRSISIFGWKPFGSMSTINKIDYQELKLNEISVGNQSTATTSATSSTSSASYTAARDIYQTNNFIGINLVNEDEFAIKIKELIKKAEKLGY